MAFKTQSEDQDTMSEINVTPLVDVMLVLVIILLVTAPLITQSVNVKLPETTQAAADNDDQPLQIEINAQGSIYLNKQPIADFPALDLALKEELEKNPEAAVYLNADQKVIYATVAQVMAIVQHAGINKMAFMAVEE